MSQRVYFTDKKPFFFIELFLFLNIPELPKYPDDLMISINDWLTLSLIRSKHGHSGAKFI
jgi:hypothetical protein